MNKDGKVTMYFYGISLVYDFAYFVSGEIKVWFVYNKCV